MPGPFKLFEALAVFRGDTSDINRKTDEAEKRVKRASTEVERAFSQGFGRGANRAGDALGSLGEKAGQAFGLITSPVGLAVAGITALAAAVVSTTKAGLEFDREFVKTRVFLDSAEEADVLRNRLVGLAGGLGTLEERSRTLRTALLDTGNVETALQLEAAAAGLAKITDADPSQTVSILGGLMDSTGRKADELETIAARMFFTMKSGGGDIRELGGEFVALVDTAATIGIELEEIQAALIALGRVAGSDPRKNLTALNIGLAALEQNASKLRQRGFDIAGADTLAEKLQILIAATGGTREGLREVGVVGRNATAILKLAANGADELTTSLNRVLAVGSEEFNRAVATRARAASTQIEALRAEVKALQAAAGEKGIRNLFGLFSGPEKPEVKAGVALDEQKKAAEERIRLIDEEIAKQRQQANLTPGFSIPRLKQLADEKQGYVNVLAELDQLIENEQARAEAQEDVNRATREGVQLSGANAEAARRQAAEFARLAEIAGITAQEVRELSEAERQSIRALAESQERGIAEAATRAAEELERVIDRERTAATARIQSTLAVTEAEQALEDARAAAEGRLASGTRRIHEERRQAAEETARVEIEAIQRTLAAQEQGIEQRIASLRRRLEDIRETPGFDRNFALRRQATDLENQIAAETDRITSQRQESASKIRDIEERLATDLDTLRLRETQALEEQERRRFDIFRSRGEAILSLRRSFGQGTVQQELAFQARLVAITKDGSQQQLDAIKSAADKARELREGARGLAGSLVSRVAASFREEGIEDVDIGQFQRRLNELRQRGQETIAGFRSGQVVNLSDLGQGLGDLGLFEQFNRFGGSIAGVVEAATRSIPSTFEAAFSGTLTATDNFVDQLTEKLDAGATRIESSLFDTIYNRLVRRLQDEASRF